MELYLLTPPEADFLTKLESVLDAGVNRLQYRRPGLSDAEQYQELTEIKSLTDDRGIPLIVNDRPDLALAVEAEGVHLGEDDLPVSPVKEAWPELQVGRTQRAGESPHETADYLSVGPIFTSPTKTVDANEAGWEGARAFAERTDNPVYAIGGIRAERLKDVPQNLVGVAVISAVWDHSDPAEAVRELSGALKQ